MSKEMLTALLIPDNISVAQIVIASEHPNDFITKEIAKEKIFLAKINIENL